MSRTLQASLLLTALFCLVWSLIPAPGLANDYVSKQTNFPAKVPDTGQLRCYDTHKKITCPEPGEPFYGQDGNYSINAPQYERVAENGDEILTDLITDLSWQLTTESTPFTWSEAVDYARKLQLAGFTDWRLPAKQELQSILSYGHTPTPLVKPKGQGQSPGSPGQKYSAWTITTRMFPSLEAKAIDLDDKQGTLSNKYEKKYAYAVRGPALTYGDYKNNGDGTITDQQTGLTWQTIEVRPMKWEKALAYCEQQELGGFTDWRLPTIKELSTLVNEKQINPSIDTTFFPTTRSAPYWTSTTFAEHPGFAWYVSFDNGLEYNGGYKGRRYFIRPVRGGTVIAKIPEPSIQPEEILEPSVLPRLAPVMRKLPAAQPLPKPAELAQPAKTEKVEKPTLPAVPEQENMDMLEPYPLDL